jgi:mRNA-degrading endonuclease RelE of RelBE toxin-antitoxin system
MPGSPPGQEVLALLRFVISCATIRSAGKPLLALFQGDWSARRGHHWVRYRIDDDKPVITVIDIADRTDIYHPGRV